MYVRAGAWCACERVRVRVRTCMRHKRMIRNLFSKPILTTLVTGRRWPNHMMDSYSGTQPRPRTPQIPRRSLPHRAKRREEGHTKPLDCYLGKSTQLSWFPPKYGQTPLRGVSHALDLSIALFRSVVAAHPKENAYNKKISITILICGGGKFGIYRPKNLLW